MTEQAENIDAIHRYITTQVKPTNTGAQKTRQEFNTWYSNLSSFEKNLKSEVYEKAREWKTYYDTMNRTAGVKPQVNMANEPRSATITKTRAVIRKGSTGQDVRDWRKILKLSDGANFDAVTEKATKEWQGKNGLETDGIVGPKSWGRAMELAGTSAIATGGGTYVAPTPKQYQAAETKAAAVKASQQIAQRVAHPNVASNAPASSVQSDATGSGVVNKVKQSVKAATNSVKAKTEQTYYSPPLWMKIGGVGLGVLGGLAALKSLIPERRRSQ